MIHTKIRKYTKSKRKNWFEIQTVINIDEHEKEFVMEKRTAVCMRD